MTSHNNNLDLANMMIKIQQQLAALDQKVDHYFKNALPKPVTNLPSPQNAQPSQPSSPRPAVAQAMATGNSRPANQHQRPGRTIFKATCAECQKECEIPFKPTGGRPVYCKECFTRRKANPASKAPITNDGPVSAFSVIQQEADTESELGIVQTSPTKITKQRSTMAKKAPAKKKVETKSKNGKKNSPKRTR